MKSSDEKASKARIVGGRRKKRLCCDPGSESRLFNRNKRETKRAKILNGMDKKKEKNTQVQVWI